MSSIATLLANILNSRYGEDVRGSIHDAIEQCYSDVNNPTLLTTGIEGIIDNMVLNGRISGAIVEDLGLLTEGTSNLFDFTTITAGRVNTSTGAIDTASGYWTSDWIPVTSGKTYYFANTDRRVFYNSSKAYSSNISSSSSWTASANGYIRISVTTANRKTAKVNVDSSKPYRPGRSAIDYNLRDNTYTKSEVDAAIDAITIETDAELETAGAAADAKAAGDAIREINASLGNIIDVSDGDFSYTYSSSNMTKGVIDLETGSITPNNGYYVSDYIPVTTDTVYYFSGNNRVGYYNSSKGFVSSISSPVCDIWNGGNWTPSSNGYVRVNTNDLSRSVFKNVVYSAVDIVARSHAGVESICSGNFNVNDMLFDSTKASAGDTLYYKTYLLQASNNGGAGYVAFYNSSNQIIGGCGTISGEQANINEIRLGVTTLPEGFSYAKWTGNKPGTVEYITKYMPQEYFNKFYCGEKVDLLTEYPSYVSGACYDPNTKAQATYSTTGVTSYIPVAPGGKVTLNRNLGTKSCGHAFFTNKAELIKQYASVQGIEDVVYEVPENAAYIRISFQLSARSDTHAWYEPPALIPKPTPDYKLNPYIRRSIKGYGEYYLSNEFTHCMAARICYFNGKKIIAYRAGFIHDARTTSSLWGSILIDSIAPDGRLVHHARYTASDFGCTGDASDPYIEVSKDGNYLILLASFNRGTSQNPTDDCAVVCFDKSLNVVDYKKVVADLPRHFFGKPLITPEGHLLFNVYTNANKQYVYRSNEVFEGTVSGLTFTDTLIVDTDSVTHNEGCMGYHNDQLFMLIRYDSTEGKIMWTENLEGNSGWSTPVSIGAKIHSPMLLPYHNGKYIPFVCSYFNPDTPSANRVPAIGYLDVDTENGQASIIGVGNLDTALNTGAQNGYPDFVPLGNENYAVVYYQEDATNTYSGQHQQTGLYYKYINAREIIPEAVWFLD